MERSRESACFTKEQEQRIKELAKQAIKDWLKSEPSSSSFHCNPSTRESVEEMISTLPHFLKKPTSHDKDEGA